jgi:hypothetical protein
MVSAPPMQKPVTPTLAAARLEVLHRAAHVLRRGVAEVQVGHQVVGLFGLDRALAAVQVGHQRV